MKARWQHIRMSGSPARAFDHPSDPEPPRWHASVDGNDDRPATVWSQEDTQKMEDFTAGNALSQMMVLRAARAPLATQDEMRARLWQFSGQGTGLPHDAFFYANPAQINLMSRAIEGQMTDHAQTGEFYAGVQRLSQVADRLPRYRALLRCVRYGYLYGLHDLEGASEQGGFSHPRLMTLVLDHKRRTDLEWFCFVVIDTPSLRTALVTQQIEGDLWSDTSQRGMYKGFWTFDPHRVQQVVHILRQAARRLLE